MNGKEIILKADRKLSTDGFDFPDKKGAQHEIGATSSIRPSALVIGYTRRKIEKDQQSCTGQRAAKSVHFAEEIPQPSATIIDGMALVQKTKGDQKPLARWLYPFYHQHCEKEVRVIALT